LVLLPWSVIFPDLASPAEAGFAKAGNRFPLFGIVLQNEFWRGRITARARTSDSI
jgi:hypothetical protein